MSGHLLFIGSIGGRKGRGFLSDSFVVAGCNWPEIFLLGLCLAVYRTVYSLLIYNRNLLLPRCLNVSLSWLLPHFG